MRPPLSSPRSRQALAAVRTAAIVLACAAGAASAGHDDCGACHLGGVAPAGVEATGCRDCHEGLLQPPGRTAPAASGHVGGRAVGVLTAGGEPEVIDCLSCHTGHPNGSPAQLRLPEQVPRGRPGLLLDPVTRLCIGCHRPLRVQRGSNGHYLTHPVGVRVPALRVAGPRAPRLIDVRGTPARGDDDVIGCTTCHHVHAAVGAKLLRWTSSAEMSEACRSCHELGGGDAQPRGTLTAGR